MQLAKLNKLANIVLVLAVLLFVFGSGYRLGELRPQKKNTEVPVSFSGTASFDKPPLDLSLFWNVWNQLAHKYVDQKKLNSEKMLYGAIKGMVSSLEDPYTYFLTPEENKEAKADLNGRYEGIGAQLGLKDGQVIIVAPLKGSPAEAAGAKPGDIIVAVDGESSEGWTLAQAVNKIRGPKGTSVVLKIVRNAGEPFDLKITRQEIKIASVELEFKKAKGCKNNCAEVAYLKVSQFGDDTNKEWDAAVLKIKQKWNAGQIKGVVLDLRNNPGGYLEGAVYLASEFLPMGKKVVRQEYVDKSGKNYTVQKGGLLLDVPVVVLINEGSASASEILAGALKDHGRAVVVGKKSFGKGSIQEALDLVSGAGLHVTVAKWILPNGTWINSKGVSPDIEVQNQVKDGNTLTEADDKQLETAIDELLK